MTIKRETLEAAASAGMLKYGQVDNLLIFLIQQELKDSRQSAAGRFNVALLAYVGGMLALGAAALFAIMAVNALGVGALLWFSVLYCLIAIGIAHWCTQRELGFPAAIFSLIAIALVPVAVFSVQYLQGQWAGGLDAVLNREIVVTVDQRWLMMEMAALAASAVLLAWFRLPFLVLPTAFIAWVIGMDVLPAIVLHLNSIAAIAITGSPEEMRKAFTLITGLLMIAAGLVIDLNRRPAYDSSAFWAYFGGLIAFSAAVPLLLADHLTGKLLYLLVHVGLVVVGAILGRRVFEVFGGIGIALVLGDMAWEVFHNSVAFVPVLTMLSLAMLATALWWWRSEPSFSVKLRGLLPQDVRELLGTRTA